MKIGQKKEGWLGITLTGVLCILFLVWWFRPQPPAWQHETPAQLIARAAAEPPPSGEVEQQVLDFDFMEAAILQAHGGMLDEAVKTIPHIRTPAIRLRAVRQLAQAYLNTDPGDYGEALTLANLLPDETHRGIVRSEVLGKLAELGFADAALPEAKTPLQKAALARRLAATNSVASARELLAAALPAVSTLPPAEAEALRTEIAWTQVNLSIVDGPVEAITAIEALPPALQGPLWEELTGWCQGRADKATVLPVIMQHIHDPALRRRLEIESLLFDVKLRPAADILAECQAEADRAPGPEAKLEALLALSDAQRNCGDPALGTKAEETLKLAGQTAATIADPAARCRALLSLSRKLCNFNLFDAAAAALTQARAAIETVAPEDLQIPLLISAAEETFMQAHEPEAVVLLERAQALVLSSTRPPASDALQELATAIVRRGDWPRGLALAARITDSAARLAALEAAAEAASIDSMSMDPANPPPRGEPVDGIRRQAAGDDAIAAALVEKQAPGYPRARAWLAMAKGLMGPPSNLNDYLATGAQPADDPPPAEEDAPAPPAESPEKP